MARKKSYSKMFVQEDQQNIPEVESTPLVEETPVHVAEPVLALGVVIECTKLNVREHPDLHATILCVLSVGSEIKIDTDNDYGDWVHVFTAAGQEGYCMKQFVKIK